MRSGAETDMVGLKAPQKFREIEAESAPNPFAVVFHPRQFPAAREKPILPSNPPCRLAADK